MRKLKYFESFESLTFDIDDLHWTKATISLSILRGKDVTDLGKIKKMIEDYKITYIKNDEWGGGPTNREWLQMYCGEFGLNEAQAWNAYKPCVKLNIQIESFGVATIGFSIYSKKSYTIDFQNLGKKIDCDRCQGTGVGPTGQCTRYGCRRGKLEDTDYDKEKDHLSQYLKKNVFDAKLTYDKVIDMFNIDVQDNFDYTSIIEDSNTSN
jgi:hypothetical protein